MRSQVKSTHHARQGPHESCALILGRLHGAGQILGQSPGTLAVEQAVCQLLGLIAHLVRHLQEGSSRLSRQELLLQDNTPAAGYLQAS